MKKIGWILVLFLSIIKSVSAQPYYWYGSWGDFWFEFWYGYYPYGFFEMSWGFFLLVVSLLTIVIGMGLQRTRVFNTDDKSKKLAILVAIIISIIATSVSPLAFWLAELFYFSAWILTLLLIILILIVAWSILHVGWEKGSEERAKATTSAASARGEREEARKTEHEKKVEGRLKRDELRKLEKIRKAANQKNIRGLTQGLNELEDLLKTENRIVAKMNKAADEAARKVGMITPYFREDKSGDWIDGIDKTNKSAYSDMEKISEQMTSLAADIGSKFGTIWTEYKALTKFGNEEDMDKATTAVKAMKHSVRKIHSDESRMETLEAKFNRAFNKAKRLLKNRPAVVKRNIKGMVKDLENMLGTENRIVANMNAAADDAARKVGMALPIFKFQSGDKWLFINSGPDKPNPSEKSAFADIEKLSEQMTSLAEDIENRFGIIWTEYRDLPKEGNKEEMDKATADVETMKKNIKKIHSDERRMRALKSRFDRSFGRVRNLLRRRTPPITI